MSSSLDDLLREIESEQGKAPEVAPRSAGLENLPTYEAEKSRPNSSPFLVPEMIGQVPQLTREMIGGGHEVSENGVTPRALTARQRALPKISLHMVGSVLAVLVLMVGLGSSVLLSQRSQDVRQQAYEGQQVELPSSDTNQVEESQTTETSETISEAETRTQTEVSSVPVSQPTPLWQQPIFIGGLAVILSAGLLIAAFIHWLFAA